MEERSEHKDTKDSISYEVDAKVIWILNKISEHIFNNSWEKNFYFLDRFLCVPEVYRYADEKMIFRVDVHWVT